MKVCCWRIGLPFEFDVVATDRGLKRLAGSVYEIQAPHPR